jgi:hypothetical protein
MNWPNRGEYARVRSATALTIAVAIVLISSLTASAKPRSKNKAAKKRQVSGAALAQSGARWSLVGGSFAINSALPGSGWSPVESYLSLAGLTPLQSSSPVIIDPALVPGVDLTIPSIAISDDETAATVTVTATAVEAVPALVPGEIAGNAAVPIQPAEPVRRPKPSLPVPAPVVSR